MNNPDDTKIKQILKNKFGLTYIQKEGDNFAWEYDGNVNSDFVQQLNNAENCKNVLSQMMDKRPYNQICLILIGTQKIIIIGWNEPLAVITSLNSEMFGTLIAQLGDKTGNPIYSFQGAYLINYSH